MFSKIWQILRRWVQRLLGRERTPQPQAPPASPLVETPLSDAEYEAIFLQLLDGVHQGWSRGQVKGFLLGKRINESYLVAWLQRFGERLQASPLDHAELIHRLVLLGNLDIGELSAVARKISQELLPQLPPPPEPPADEWPVIEAIFKGNGLGSAGEKRESQQIERIEAIFKGNGLGSAGEKRESQQIERTEATSSEANEEAKKWFDQGNQKLMQGDFLGAIASYERAIEVQPNFPVAYVKLGIVLCDFLSRYEEALTSFDQAIKLKSDFATAHQNRGVVLCNLGRYEEAIASYERAIRLELNATNAYVNRGKALYELGRYEEAIASYDFAITLQPNTADVYVSRGNALCKLGCYEEAVASYNRAIKLQPNFPLAYVNQGSALSELGCYEEAIASYDCAIELQPNFPGSWLNRGTAAGLSIRPGPSLTSMSAIARKNPQLNQRGYHGKLASYEAGLKHCPQDTHPEGWGLLNQHIGNAHYNRARREVQRSSYYRKAESSYNRALITLTKDAFPERHLEVLQDLIKVLFRLQRQAEAAEILRRGSDLLRELVKQYQQTRRENAAQQLQLKFASFQQLTVDLLCQEGKSVEAWEVAEEGKNACLTWLLPGGNEAFVTPKYAEIQPLLNPTTAAIYWHTSPVSLTTFIIRADRDRPTVIEKQAAETNSEEPEEIRRLERLEKWQREWDQDYRNAGKAKEDKSEAQQWRDRLADRLKELADILNIPKILAQLNSDNGIKQIILFPHQDLHRLPLEALFPNDFTLIRLPSVQMGLHLQQNCRHTGNTPSTTPTLLCVQPPKSKAPGIPYGEIESTAVCHLFDSYTSLASHEVTRKKLAQELTSGYRVFHFSGHGKHEPLHPKLSQLDLSGTDTIKLEEICGLYLQGYDLVTLSACETAIAANQTITTEYVGLVSAFLYAAGVAYVLSTLWKVESEATAILTLKFYTLFLAGEPAPRAIAIANRWLRDATWDDILQFYQELRTSLGADEIELDQALELPIDTILEKELTAQPFINPYYWSAFVLTGLPIQSSN